MKKITPWMAFLVLCLWIAADAHAAQSVRLWDVRSRNEISLKQFASKISGTGIVFVGETHDRLSHHQGQLQIIRAIDEAKKPVSVGLEMFRQVNQSVLNEWISGKLNEERFQDQFLQNWGSSWPLYRDIFLYARNHKIPMVGLNVPRELTAQVAREGFQSLNREQVGQLPSITCEVDPEYKEIMRSAHGHAMNEASFTHFCEAQLVWDTAMAFHALDYLKQHPDRTLVVLAGYIHAWRKGIPARVTKQNPLVKQIVILPSTPGRMEKSNATVEDCDYLLLGLKDS